MSYASAGSRLVMSPNCSSMNVSAVFTGAAPPPATVTSEIATTAARGTDVRRFHPLRRMRFPPPMLAVLAGRAAPSVRFTVWVGSRPIVRAGSAAALQTRVEDVTQCIAEQVPAENEQDDRGAGDDQRVPVRERVAGGPGDPVM